MSLNRDLKRTGKIYGWFNFISSTFYLFYHFIYPQSHNYSLIHFEFFVAEKLDALS